MKLGWIAIALACAAGCGGSGDDEGIVHQLWCAEVAEDEWEVIDDCPVGTEPGCKSGSEILDCYGDTPMCFIFRTAATGGWDPWDPTCITSPGY